jgi:membrane protein
VGRLAGHLGRVGAASRRPGSSRRVDSGRQAADGREALGCTRVPGRLTRVAPNGPEREFRGNDGKTAMTSVEPGGESAPVEVDKSGGVGRRVRRGTELVKEKTAVAKEKYAGSSAEHLWSRLNSMDFINRGMLFAATLLLCFFPFIIVANALAGRSAADGLARRLGLNKEAAADVAQLFTSSSATSGAITGTAWVWFILGGVAAATAIQQLYERAFEVDSRGMKDMPRRLIWLAVLVGASALGGWVGPSVRNAGGPVLLGVLGLIVLTAFWWFTLWLLLGGRIPWGELFPSAIATAVCWLGMAVVFSIIFSSTVISYDKKYGTVGVVFALMSWFIAIGVVIILGAIVGVVWRQRGLSFKAALAALRRKRKTSTAARP